MYSHNHVFWQYFGPARCSKWSYSRLDSAIQWRTIVPAAYFSDRLQYPGLGATLLTQKPFTSMLPLQVQPWGGHLSFLHWVWWRVPTSHMQLLVDKNSTTNRPLDRYPKTPAGLRATLQPNCNSTVGLHRRRWRRAGTEDRPGTDTPPGWDSAHFALPTLAQFWAHNTRVDIVMEEGMGQVILLPKNYAIRETSSFPLQINPNQLDIQK